MDDSHPENLMLVQKIVFGRCFNVKGVMVKLISAPFCLHLLFLEKQS